MQHFGRASAGLKYKPLYTFRKKVQKLSLGLNLFKR